MAYATLLRILDQEGTSFLVTKNDWRPTNLLSDYQTKLLLGNIITRHKQLQVAAEEFKTLDRANIYFRLYKRMGLRVRDAILSRRLDHLTFFVSVARFYEDFGRMLRLLKMDRMRGKLDSPTTVGT